MKFFYLICIFILMVASCQKEIRSDSPNVTYMEKVRTVLKDSLSDYDFGQLNFSGAKITKSAPSTFYLKIPFKQSSISSQFVVVKTSREGTVFSGLIIN